MSLIIEKLNKNHIKIDFDCDNELLNNYIQKQARQDVNRDLSVCYILNDTNKKRVLGYFTLSGNSIDKNEFPIELLQKMPPSYIKLPTILLGRLAIDKNEKVLSVSRRTRCKQEPHRKDQGLDRRLT